MKAHSAGDASIYDLQFYHDMINYRLIDEEVANVVWHKLQNHRWYLTKEVVPLTIFSNIPDATPELKQAIVAKAHVKIGSTVTSSRKTHIPGNYFSRDITGLNWAKVVHLVQVAKHNSSLARQACC